MKQFFTKRCYDKVWRQFIFKLEKLNSSTKGDFLWAIVRTSYDISGERRVTVLYSLITRLLVRFRQFRNKYPYSRYLCTRQDSKQKSIPGRGKFFNLLFVVIVQPDFNLTKKTSFILTKVFCRWRAVLNTPAHSPSRKKSPNGSICSRSKRYTLSVLHLA